MMIDAQVQLCQALNAHIRDLETELDAASDCGLLEERLEAARGV
jgi:hypothetical protein